MATIPGHTPHAIPAASLARLAAYRGVLEQLVVRHVETVSSNTLAESAGVNPAQLRKDLSMLGSLGTRGVGYDVATLVAELDEHIGSARDWHIVLVGIGNLGRALVGHSGSRARGFTVKALFDNDPAVIGTEIDGHRVHSMAELAAVVDDPQWCIGIISTPPEAAQQVAQQLVAAGLKSVLNFTPVALKVPADVVVRRVDLGAELQILAYHRQLSLAAQEGRPPHPG